MPVTIKVNGTSLSLVHKGSNGISTATVPDICKTPAPPGPPVPIPYPNISMSSDLMDGTTTVAADGGNMIAIKGSQFMKSTGDEPGVAGGVASSTFIKESTWILYSFDVKMDGANACRLSDKKFQNHQNTVDAVGTIQVPVFQPPSDPKCASIYQVIFEILFGQHTFDPITGRPLGRKGIAFYWEDIAANPGRWSAERNQTHMDEYNKGKQGLKKKLEEWGNKKKRNCNDDDLPPRARDYASDELPVLDSGKLVPDPVSSSSALQGLAKALRVSVGVAIGIVVVSRIIRLIPPLWPTQLSPI